MIAYDSSFSPPAPVLSVILASVVRSRPRVTSLALIDSGSDITAIPANVAERLQLQPFGRLYLEDLRAARRIVNTYATRLTAPGQPTTEIEVILTSLPFVVLGRDWLNQHYLLLNGPEQEFRLSGQPFWKG